MPVGARVRSNNVFGLVSDNPLAAANPTMNSNSLANLPAIVGTQHAVITLDPLRVYGAPEIVVVTAHTASATVATVTRGAYGTVTRSHPQGTLWTHTPMNEDFVSILTSGTRPADPYNGEIIYETDTKAYKMRESVGAAWEDLINPLGVWTSYTPTLTQSATVTKTVIYAKYIKIGRMVTVEIILTVTGTGTGANAVLIGLPPITPALSSNFMTIGVGNIFDSSAVLVYRGIAEIVSSTTFELIATNSTAAGALGADTFTQALAVNDVVRSMITYESAT